MVFGGNSIANTPENGHALGSKDSLKVLIHNLPHKVNIFGDLALIDHWRRLLRIFMESREVVVVFNSPQALLLM